MACCLMDTLHWEPFNCYLEERPMDGSVQVNDAALRGDAVVQADGGASEDDSACVCVWWGGEVRNVEKMRAHHHH